MGNVFAATQLCSSIEKVPDFESERMPVYYVNGVKICLLCPDVGVKMSILSTLYIECNAVAPENKKGDLVLKRAPLMVPCFLYCPI